VQFPSGTERNESESHPLAPPQARMPSPENPSISRQREGRDGGLVKVKLPS